MRDSTGFQIEESEPVEVIGGVPKQVHIGKPHPGLSGDSSSRQTDGLEVLLPDPKTLVLRRSRDRGRRIRARLIRLQAGRGPEHGLGFDFGRQIEIPFDLRTLQQTDVRYGHRFTGCHGDRNGIEGKPDRLTRLPGVRRPDDDPRQIRFRRFTSVKDSHLFHLQPSDPSPGNLEPKTVEDSLFQLHADFPLVVPVSLLSCHHIDQLRTDLWLVLPDFNHRIVGLPVQRDCSVFARSFGGRRVEGAGQ